MDDVRLSDLLYRWAEAARQGRNLSAEDLCRDCPDLTDELRRRIAAVQGANRFALISRRSDLPPADGLITSPGTAAYTPSQPLPQPADAAPQPQSTAAAA